MSGRSGKLSLKLNLSRGNSSAAARGGDGRSSDGGSPSSCVSSEEEEEEEEEMIMCSGSPEAASMVLAGCPRCLMYVMLSEDDPKCPKCKSKVLLDFLHDKKAKMSARRS